MLLRAGAPSPVLKAGVLCARPRARSMMAARAASGAAASGSSAPEAASGSPAVVLESGSSKVKRTAVALNHPRSPSGAQFRVMQWNILADGLAQNGDFVRVPPDCLEWAFRKPLVLEELLEGGADVICLQECNHYDELLAKLEGLGYAGAFHAKVCSPAERYKCPPDGMAVFYNSRRFTPVGEAQGHTFLDDQGQKQSQGFLQVMLHDKVMGRDVLFVTTHLKAKEGSDCEVVRMKQARQLLRSISATLSREAAVGNGASSSSTDNGNGNGYGHGPAAFEASALPTTTDESMDDLASSSHVPVVITGDFNTVPDSGTCQAVREHALCFKSIWDQPALPSNGAVAGNGGNSPNAASSGSNGSTSTSGRPAAPPREFSTWKYRSKGESKRVIDYIWFSGNGLLRPLQRWRMLTEAEIGPDGLPSRSYASDHISLCAEFEWELPGLASGWLPPRPRGEQDWD